MTTSRYKISIIVPIYNAVGRFEPALSSILNQSIGFQNLELILINDASTDDSAQMLAALSVKYDNVVIVNRIHNSGFAGGPRNQGVKMATSDYIMFLDQDDSYYPNACRDLYEAITKQGVDIVSGYNSEHDLNGKMILNKAVLYDRIKEFRIANIDEMPETLKFRAAVWAKIYRKEMILSNSIEFPEDVPVEDLVFFVRIAMVMVGFAYIDKPIVKYVLRNAGDRSLTYSINPDNMRRMGYGFEIAYSILQEHGKEKYYPYLNDWAPHFYLDTLIDNVNAPDDVLEDCLKGLRFIYEKTWELSLSRSSKEVEHLAKIIYAGDFVAGAVYIREIAKWMPAKRRMQSIKRKIKKLIDRT